MSFLKNLGDKALNTAKVVGNKSQDLMEIGKLKMHISQLEGDIKKLKGEIGEVVYNAYINGQGSPSEQVVALCDSISAKYAEIEETKAKIDQVQND
ncbi:hypothetical protein [Lutispora sp.]|uniref:hypothetical protein n=1 Tax=Lutispora sp. TaxID=2828727 RepID=UPI000EE68AFC|nr:hypothetical protein [Lutispora sp.]MEA4963405.1 hypothetical protein [Lutispora sp.]HCJ58779.1 hypothetical protein [Clostridiaceae bacterium]